MSPEEKTTISISTGTMVRFLLLIVLFWFVYQLRDVITIVLTAIVIASSLEPAAHWFQRHNIPRLAGIIAIYLGAFLFFGTVFYLIVPPLLSDIGGVFSSLPVYLDRTFNPSAVFSFFPLFPDTFTHLFQDNIPEVGTALNQAASGFFKTASAIFGGALSFILIIVISFYLSVQEHGIENFLRVITPKEYEGYVLDVWSRSRRKIGFWLQGQLLLGILVGVLVFMGLTILGVKYALLLAILSAIFEIIPVFGPIMAAIPAIAVAFLQAPGLALGVFVFYIIVQQFENHLIYPVVVRKTVGVPPLMVVLSLLVGGTLAGFFGLLLAVPVAAVLVEIANDIARKKEIVF